MAELQPLPFLRGVDPSNIPQQYLRARPGESTEILMNERGEPQHRLIPVERGDLDWEKVQQLPEPVYNAHFARFHPRTSEGGISTQPSATSYLTADPNLSEEEAIAQLKQRLQQYGVHKQLATEWPKMQDIMDFTGPGVGAMSGGMAGFAAGGGTPASVPLALAGAGIGGALGTLIPRATRPELTPSRITSAEQEAPGPYMAKEGVEGAVQGVVGEGLNQFVNLARLGVRALGFSSLVRDIDITPEQAALLGPGGPFRQAGALTGEMAYPRISTYARGPIESIDDRVANALFSRYWTQQHARSLDRNLGALVTDEMTRLQATGETVPFAERMMQWLGTVDKDGIFQPGTIEHGLRSVQNGLYQAANDIVASQPTPTILATDNMAAVLGTRGIGQGERSPVAAAVDAKIRDALSGLERRTISTTERTTETASVGGTTERRTDHTSRADQHRATGQKCDATYSHWRTANTWCRRHSCWR